MTAGFTFLELLIATAIIAVIGVALISAQTSSVRASRTAREMHELAYETRRALTETHLRVGPERLESLENGRWRFVEQPSMLDAGSNATFWHHWQISREPSGTPASRFTLRAPR